MNLALMEVYVPVVVIFFCAVFTDESSDQQRSSAISVHESSSVRMFAMLHNVLLFALISLVIVISPSRNPLPVRTSGLKE